MPCVLRSARRAGSGSWVRLLCRGGGWAWCLWGLAQNGTWCLMGKPRRAPISSVKRELFPKAAPGLWQELEGLMVTRGPAWTLTSPSTPPEPGPRPLPSGTSVTSQSSLHESLVKLSGITDTLPWVRGSWLAHSNGGNAKGPPTDTHCVGPADRHLHGYASCPIWSHQAHLKAPQGQRLSACLPKALLSGFKGAEEAEQMLFK